MLRRGESWEWICHEAVTSPGAVRAPRYARSSDGTWLATVSDLTQGRGGQTLFRSTDGCSWDDVTGAEGRLVAAATFAAGSATEAWAVTAEADGTSVILASVDGGATWVEDTPADGRRFYGLHVGGDALFATATDLGGTRGFLWHRPAGGAWTEREVPLPAGTEGAHLNLLTARDAQRAWVVVDPQGDDTLLETSDAGATWTEVFVASGEIVDGAADASGLWVALNGLEMVRIEGSSVSAPIPDFPLAIGLETVGDTLFTAPQSYLVGPLLSRMQDDGSFAPLAYPDDVAAPKECPADSEVARICVPLWDTLLPNLRGFDDPPIETAEDTAIEPEPQHDSAAADASSGCGCASGPAPSGLAVDLPWLLGRRR